MGKRLKVGDTIQCSSADELVDMMYALEKADYETEFCYEKDGNRGWWIVIEGDRR